jgi:hypothetical protein
MSCFNKQGEVKADDSKYTGTEPTWDDVTSLTEEEIVKRADGGLSFYGYYCSSSDLMPDLLGFMATAKYSKEDIKIVKKYGEKIGTYTASKIARMFNRGLPTTINGNGDYRRTWYGYVIERIDDVILKGKALDVVKKEEKDENVKETNTIQLTPQQRLVNKVNTLVISELELVIDEMLLGIAVEEVNIVSLLGENAIPEKGCNLIQDALMYELKEFELIKSGKDEQMNEAYDFVKKSSLNKIIKTLKDWLLDVEKYKLTVKKTKVRVKKVKPAGVQVRDLNYDKDNSKISPVKIPGSVDTIIFNSKTRKLQVYKAVGRQGLSVKGTSIKDFDDVKSYQVTVRENMIDSVVGKDPKALEKIISPKTKRTKVNGRVNEHCRIVYVK